MGEWAKHEFAREVLPKRCFLFAGTTPKHVKNSILDYYDEVVFHKHDVYERYIVKGSRGEDVLIFQAYGAAVVADLLTILKDGKVEQVIFIGTAFGLSNKLRTGDVVLPTEVQCLDGVTNLIDSVTQVSPDKELRKQLQAVLQQDGIGFQQGRTVSVPTVFWRLDGGRFDPGIIALEMELSAFIHFTARLGLKSAGLLIISDTVNHSLLDDQTLRFQSIVRVFASLVNGLK